MRKYRRGAGSGVRLDYGYDLAEGLRSFPETTGLADGFETVNETLEQKAALRVAKRKPRAKSRARLRRQEYQVDQTLRFVSREAEGQDGHKQGLIYRFLFPDTLSETLSPSGPQKLKPLEEVLRRLENGTQPGIATVREHCLVALRTARDEFQQAIGEYKAACKAEADARDDEYMCRGDHEREVDRLMGLVRGTFPGDRMRQDVVFPEVQSGKRTVEDEDDDEQTPAENKATLAKKPEDDKPEGDKTDPKPPPAKPSDPLKRP